MRFLIALALLFVQAAPVSAGCQGTQHKACSKTFTAHMRCDAIDGLASIQGNHCPAGKTCPYCPTGKDCPLIDPWEPEPIKIVGIELAVTYGTITWAFAGNNFQPDVMKTMGAGQIRVEPSFPEGITFSMPAAGTPGENHIDLHIACERGWLGKRAVSMLYTVYYTTSNGE